jgi:hypothetical protein
MTVLPIPTTDLPARLVAEVPTHVTALCSGNNTNPFCGVTPNFDWLGDGFNVVWVAALGGVLALALIILAFFFIRALVGLRKAMDAKKPNDAEHARNILLGTGLAIGGVILAPTLFVAITTAAQQGAS